MQVVVVTPEATALDEKCESVQLPLFDGSLGILANHAPMIGRLGFGEMAIKASGKSMRYYVDGGFVQVADNVVSVLTGRAISVEKIDAAEARQALADAEAMASGTAEQTEIKTRAIAQAKAMLNLAS